MNDVKNLKGKNFQEWALTEVLGNGADGIVYLGEKNDKQVAVKLFFPDILKKNGEEEARVRLDLQLGLCGQKHHPNLVEVYYGGYDADLGTLFLIMEHIKGASLDKVISKIPQQNLSNLFRQLCAAAQHLESKGLYHRDIKPANIVISEDFSHLTLLDLGIIFKPPADDEGRLSRDEFVATLRYSPPEFVWRSEESGDPQAWRAITFYQLGATLHDMLMRQPLFTGFDQPHATLYDSVRWRTPIIEAPEDLQWLVKIAKCCLVKDWHQRSQLVTWENIGGYADAEQANEQHRHLIRLRQVLAEEEKTLKSALTQKGDSIKSRPQELWDLHDRLFLELRRYLMGDSIFPKFSAIHTSKSDTEYELSYLIERDENKLFTSKLDIRVTVKSADDLPAATEIQFRAINEDGLDIYSADWVEMFTMEGAATLCQAAILKAVDKMTST